MTIAASLAAIASDNTLDAATQEAAVALGEVEKTRDRREVNLAGMEPDRIHPVAYEFGALFADVACEGALIAARSSVVFVGMARSIGGILPASIERLEKMAAHFASWGAVVIENDSNDNTKDVLRAWQEKWPDHVVADCCDLDRPHLHGWELERVKAYAEYRNKYVTIAKEHWPDADYVIAVDLDAWGGWSRHGMINGIGWLARIPTAAGMASVSIYQAKDSQGSGVWAHYDQWAWRWHGWTQDKMETWFTLWLPPPGAPPIAVRSAFGGMCIYRASVLYNSKYNGDTDIEHVGLHRDMEKQGYGMYLNPGQRVLMHWLTEEQKSDGYEHSDHERGAVQT